MLVKQSLCNKAIKPITISLFLKSQHLPHPTEKHRHHLTTKPCQPKLPSTFLHRPSVTASQPIITANTRQAAELTAQTTASAWPRTARSSRYERPTTALRAKVSGPGARSCA